MDTHIVDLSSFRTEVAPKDTPKVWVPTKSTGVKDLPFVGGPRNGTTGLVPDEVERMVTPGFFHGRLAGVNEEWPGQYLYERVTSAAEDVMQYIGPTRQPEAEPPAIVHVDPSEMPACVDWGPDAL